MCFSEFPQNFLYFIHQHLVVSPENSNVHLAYLFITQKKIMCFSHAAAAAAKPLQSCPTLCDPIDGSSPGSPIPGILQAKILEWVAISFSMHESKKRKCSRSVVPDSLRPHGLQRTRLLRPWDSPGKSTGVGCHCLLRFLSYMWSNRKKLILASLVPRGCLIKNWSHHWAYMKFLLWV